DPGTGAVDHAGDVVAENARRPQAGPAPVGPVSRIDRVHSGRVHGHPDLSRSRYRVSHVLKPQLLRAAELADHDGPQPRPSSLRTLVAPAASQAKPDVTAAAACAIAPIGGFGACAMRVRPAEAGDGGYQ